MELVRKELSATEGQAPGQRYNPDCDCIQYTPDGGVTWLDDPSADPRTNIIYLLPPNEEPDPRCAGAAGMVAYVRQSVDTAIGASTVIGLANGIFAIVVAFLPITILAAVVIAIAEYLIGLGAAALIVAFSEETYDKLLCIFYDHAEADGSITEAGFTAAQAQIASEIGDVVVDGVIAALYSATGFVGWSNAAASLADPDAECPCFDVLMAPWSWISEEVRWGIFPSTAMYGVPFDAVAEDAGGQWQINMAFNHNVIVTINSVTDWTICDFSGDNSIYGWSGGGGNPRDVGNYDVVRFESGITSIPQPWDVEANGVFFTGCGGSYTVNITLTAPGG